MKYLSLFALLVLFSCSSKEIEFEKNTGNKNQIKVGERFFINLDEDHKVGSGYWSLDNGYDDKVVSYLGSTYHQDTKSVDFNFISNQIGTTEINFSQSFARDTTQKAGFILEVK